jgi:hypothetical protein
MGKNMVLLILLVWSTLCVAEESRPVIKTNAKSPTLYYQTKDTVNYAEVNSITIIANDFEVIAKKYKRVQKKLLWKTIRIRVKNQKVVASWPEEIQAFIPKKLKEPEPPNFSGSIFANPISMALLNKNKTANAGYAVRTINSKKHEFNHTFNINYMSQEDEQFNFKTEMLMVNSNLVYDYKNFYGNWTYFSIVNYQRFKFNDFYQIRDQWGVGVTGIKYTFIRGGDVVKKLDLSYVPMLDYTTSDMNLAFPGEEPRRSLTIIRNSFRFRAFLNLWGWDVKYMVNYRPAYYQDIQTLDLQDYNLLSEFSITKSISDKLSFSYTNRYTHDIRLQRGTGIRPDNTVNALTVNYSFKM